MEKKKVKIDKKFFDKVKSLAHNYYTNDHISHRKADGFLCECYTKAVLAVANADELLNVEITYEERVES